MHRPTRTAVLLVAMIAVLTSGAGCASTPPAPVTAAPTASPAPAPPTKEPIAWMDGICGALLPLGLFAGIPEIDTGDPPTAATVISTILGTMVSTMDGVIAGVKAQGPSPIKGGNEFSAKMVDGLTSFRTTALGAKTKIDTAPRDNPTALSLALQDVGTTLLSMQNPLAGIVASPEIDAITPQAPNCKAMGMS